MDEFKIYNSAIKMQLVPFMRAHNFSLHKSTRRIYQFQKTCDQYIFCVSVQMFGNSSSLRIDLGVSMDFIVHLEGIPLRDVTEAHCEFQTSLYERSHYNSGVCVGNLNPWGWKLSMGCGDVQEAQTLMREIISAFEALALPFFEQFKGFPEPLQSISLQDVQARDGNPKCLCLAAPLEQRLALTLARMYLFLGRRDESNQFAQWGLDHAKGLKPKFVELLAGKLI